MSKKYNYTGRIDKPKKIKDTILIICEGEKTEKNYFEKFKEYLNEIKVNIKVEGTGRNTLSLVEYVIKYLKHGEDYKFKWVVFDRDSFSPQDFNEALSLSKRNKINVAYSNEAFELWYLLHFDYIDTALSRDQYKSMLSERLKFKYEKNSEVMYDFLMHLQETAIRNAKKLLSTYPNPNP